MPAEVLHLQDLTCRVIVVSAACRCYHYNMKVSRSDQIYRRIEKIKTELAAINEMRPGSLTEQFPLPDTKRGYYQLSYPHASRSRTEYIPRDLVRTIRREVANISGPENSLLNGST